MNQKHNYSIDALIIFITCAIFMLYGLIYMGIFSRHTYFVKIEATTGPDFTVLLGSLKLKSQMPDTIKPQDCGGIMVNDTDFHEVCKSVHDDGISYEWDYYYVLTGKVVGAERSDGTAFHPLIKVTSSYKIGKFTFWSLAIADIFCFIFFGLYYKRNRLNKT